MAKQTIAKQRSPWWFTLRDVLWLIALVALGLAWWTDHRRLTSRADLYQLQVENLKDGPELNLSLRLFKEPDSRFATASEFVQFVETGTNDTDLLVESERFCKSESATEAVSELVGLLSHESPEVRRRAVMALSHVKHCPDLAMPAIIKLLDDGARPAGGKSVQWFAALALGKLKAVEAIPALRKRMMDDDCDIAAQAAIMIHKIDSTEKIGPRLIELCKSRDLENRWDALQDITDHVDSETANSVLVEMFEATDKSDKIMRDLIASQMNRLAASSQ